MKKIKYLAFMFCAVMMASSCDLLIDDEEGEDETEVNNGPSNNTKPDDEPSNNQTITVDGYTAEEIAKANTAANATNMNQVDKDIIMYCNLARMDGTRFWNNVASKNLEKPSSYTQSLKSDLAQVSDFPMMQPDKGLCASAKSHGDDMSKNNFFSHQSSDGTKTFDRIAKFYSGYARNENIAAGNSKAIDIVMQWLVDEGVSSLGHREAILKVNNIAVGIYTCRHPDWGHCSVMDFGATLETPMD